MSAAPSSVRRRPGVAESVISWAAWVLVGLITPLLAYSAIFPMGFAGAVPEKADEVGTVVVWVGLTVATVVLAPVGMAIGHWRHWHIWYWPVLCAAAATVTFVLLRSL